MRDNDRRSFLRAAGGTLALAITGTALAGNAAGASDFIVLPQPQPVLTGRKIEVLEIFSYACPHCNALEPLLEEWARHLPPDVELRHLPVVFHDDWRVPAQIYYTLEAMGLVSRLHAKVYDAIHLDQLDLNDPKVLLDWVAQQGVNRQAFLDTFNSFTVQTRLAQTDTLVQACHVTGVPSIVVGGKYLTSPGQTDGTDRFFQVVDQLIVRARRERHSQ